MCSGIQWWEFWWRTEPVCVCVCGLNTWHKEWAWEASTGRFGGGITRWVPVVVGCTSRRSVHLQHKHRNATRHSGVCTRIKTQLVHIKNSFYSDTQQESALLFFYLNNILNIKFKISLKVFILLFLTLNFLKLICRMLKKYVHILSLNIVKKEHIL